MKSSDEHDRRGDIQPWEAALADFLRASDAPLHLVGLGSPIRQDDGVGPVVIALLRKSLKGTSGKKVVLHDAEAEPEMVLSRIAHTSDRMVIIDAVQASQMPGDVVIADVKDTRYGFFATHNLPLKLIPGMVEASDRAILVGVQPLQADVGEGLSPGVMASAQKVANVIRDSMGWSV